MKKSIFYIIWIIFFVSLIMLGFEGVGRIIIHYRFGIPGKLYGLWEHDPELGANHRKNSYNTHTSLNNHGFRNKEDVFEPKMPNSLRIIAFGGSTTFGYNLKDGETFTGRLETKLRQVPGYEKTQVLNAGRICYSAGHNLILMKRLVPMLKPDYVIIYEGVNEIMNAWALLQDGISLDDLGARYGVIGKSYDQNRWLKRNSIIVRFIDYYVKSRIAALCSRLTAEEKETMPPEKTEDSEVHPWVIENYTFLLREMIDFLNKEGVKPIVIRYASVHNPIQERFSKISAEVAREKGVLVYDMQSHFNQVSERREDLFIYTGVHVTPRGAEIMADGLAQIILEDLRNK